jgi:hypothetical protein
MVYIIIYPSSGAHAFNAARTALHTLQERIHVLGTDYKTSLGLHTLGAQS